MKSGIYKVLNKINGDCYIGSAIDFYKRKRQHLLSLKKGVHHSIILQRAVEKYGIDNFSFELLAKCPQEYLIKLEQWFIDTYNPVYNICKNAGSCLGHKLNKESKEKIGRAVKEAFFKNEHKNLHNGLYERTSERMKGNSYAKGNKLSPERLKQLRKDRIEKGNKRVLQFSLSGEFIKEWYTTTEVADFYKVSNKAIWKSINKATTSVEYKWKYKN